MKAILQKGVFRINAVLSVVAIVPENITVR
jgi:hypothetical protein